MFRIFVTGVAAIVLLFAGNGQKCFSAVESTQTGVASPQTDSEMGNIELLRQRALRNAMDLALMEVTGASISGERGDSLRTREDIVIVGENVDETIKQQSRYVAAASSRTKGHAKLIEIVKEWQADGQYFLTARFSVDTEEEAKTRRNAGYFWLQAGKPTVALSFLEDIDGAVSEDRESRTSRFIRDNLIRNGVEVSTVQTPRYLVKVDQVLQTSVMPEFGTTTVHCYLSWKVIDVERNATVGEDKDSHGPVAGFAFEQAKDTCIGAIAPKVSEDLIKKLAEIWNDSWNNGFEQIVVIDGLPGDVVPLVNTILQNLHGVTASTPAHFMHGKFTKHVNYKGESTVFAQAVRDAFEQEDWDVTVAEIGGGRITLVWKK